MQVKQVMTKNVEAIRAEDTLQSAAHKMREHDVGVLPVHNGENAVGMVTDRDITVRGVAEGRDPTSAPVADVMTPEVVCLLEEQEVAEAAKLMEERRIRRALVLGRENTIAGIVSLGDLAVRSRDLGAQVLESVCQPAAQA